MTRRALVVARQGAIVEGGHGRASAAERARLSQLLVGEALRRAMTRRERGAYLAFVCARARVRRGKLRRGRPAAPPILKIQRRFRVKRRQAFLIVERIEKKFLEAWEIQRRIMGEMVDLFEEWCRQCES
jgi:hypothetical protein